LARFRTVMFSDIGADSNRIPVQMNFSAAGLASTAALT